MPIKIQVSNEDVVHFTGGLQSAAKKSEIMRIAVDLSGKCSIKQGDPNSERQKNMHVLSHMQTLVYNI